MTPDFLKDFRKSHEEHAGYALEGTAGCRPRADLASLLGDAGENPCFFCCFRRRRSAAPRRRKRTHRRHVVLVVRHPWLQSSCSESSHRRPTCLHVPRHVRRAHTRTRDPAGRKTHPDNTPRAQCRLLFGFRTAPMEILLSTRSGSWCGRHSRSTRGRRLSGRSGVHRGRGTRPRDGRTGVSGTIRTAVKPHRKDPVSTGRAARRLRSGRKPCMPLRRFEHCRTAPVVWLVEGSERRPLA